jgi:hypothetical protein
MKYINVKQIGCLLCVAVLMVGVGGCANHYAHPQGVESQFEVDGAQYSVVWYEATDSQGRVTFSFLILSDRAKRVFASSAHGSDSSHDRDNDVWMLHFPVSESIVVKTETLYFVQDQKVAFEKEYQELGIDAQRLNPDEMLNYLQPILEQLIREHVQPQEPEMEEMRKDND